MMPGVAENDKKRLAGRTGSRTARGGAKERAAKSAGKAPTRQKVPLINRALRDLRIIQMNAEGFSALEISEVDGRHERTIKGILASHKAHGIRGGAALLGVDPVSLMEESLNRVETIYQAAFETVMEAEGVSARVSALRLMMDAQIRKMELLQHLGLLPRHLGSFRHVIDLRQIGEQMVDVLLAVERGERTPEDAVRFFRGLANYGRPEELPEGTADEESGEAA